MARKAFYDEESRKRIYAEVSDENTASITELMLGCAQRIAASLEKMERPFVENLSRLQRLESANAMLMEDLRARNRSISALRGVITRTKKK
jgi:hypothetical protein